MTRLSVLRYEVITSDDNEVVQDPGRGDRDRLSAADVSPRDVKTLAPLARSSRVFIHEYIHVNRTHGHGQQHSSRINLSFFYLKPLIYTFKIHLINKKAFIEKVTV